MSSPGIHQSRKSMDLQQAIRLNDSKTVGLLVKDATLDLNGAIRGITPLSLAITTGHFQLVDLLISSGASVNRLSRDQNDRLEPPLFTACRLGMEAAVRSLLRARADIDQTDFYHHTPLWVATKEQRPDLVLLLLGNGAAIDVQWPWSECPLYLATKYLRYNGRQHIAKLLLRNGIAVNVCDDDGRTPLYWALWNGDRYFAGMLIACGARIEPMRWPSLDAHLSSELKSDEAFYGWLRTQLNAPAQLQCLCLHSIRRHLVKTHNRSIFEHLAKLPLPALLVKYVSLEDYFQDSPCHGNRSSCRPAADDGAHIGNSF